MPPSLNVQLAVLEAARDETDGLISLLCTSETIFILDEKSRFLNILWRHERK